MIEIGLPEIAAIVGGTGFDLPDLVLTGTVVSDSRRVQPGDLYLAIVGETHDGNDFAEAALAAGAVAAIVSRPVAGASILVDDTVAALAALARAVVQRSNQLTIYGITGSSGKTSAKDMLGQVLAATEPTVWPPGSFNNELGLPTTVLQVDAATRNLVLEMGARGIGHIEQLTKIAQPSIGLVLNVGSAHAGEFGSREATAQAKSELAAALPAEGFAILNADDPLVKQMAEVTAAQVRWFGASPDNDVSFDHVQLDALARPSFQLTIAGETFDVQLALHGEHQVSNAAAVAASAHAGGMAPAEIAEALRNVKPGSRWRMEVTRTADTTIVINDAYNANPESMAAGLKALAAMNQNGTRWAVLGEMRELGEESMRAHDEIGRLAVRLGVDRLVGIGPACRPMVVGAASEGYFNGESYYCADAVEAREYLAGRVKPGDVVLLKASRAAGLEQLAAQVIADHGGSE